MSNYRCSTTIVYSIIGTKIKEWKLQDTRREYNFIVGWIVIGIDGRWCHTPFRFINWFTHTFYHLVIFKLVYASQVGKNIVAVDDNSFIGFPFIRKANFVHNSL